MLLSIVGNQARSGSGQILNSRIRYYPSCDTDMGSVLGAGGCLCCTGQGISDFDLAAFADGGVNITGLRMVDVLNKTVRDFLLERQSRGRTTSDISQAHPISVSHYVCLYVCLSVCLFLIQLLIILFLLTNSRYLPRPR